ncbi:DegT/DnrJ/EryC1/StrS family aminotransferase [uncultured Tateyamaria sp.]|uniref:DegT/DnrJ/EryC1/StrS family aminotransferase n=1 Tax=Tateyamaria sp. 1078 TaxID=3417464 RepID=UPI0026141FCF|nr:DegT/DnrJ/EryC1/StrS family aminotransferase [uncultured Tateyamaria sp.]
MPDSSQLVTRIPVLRPELPTTDALVPYLRSLEDSRIYTNNGPMVLRLEQRLSAYFGQPKGGVTAAASGTAALIGAILTKAGRATTGKPIALCASFTFVASATAAQNCGYAPHFVDISPDHWALDPDSLHNHPRLHEAGLVVVTAPFGRLVDLAAWEAFEARTGVPVVVDCAAGFDVMVRANAPLSKTIPVAVSFHATKAFGCGEGGAVFSADPDFALRCHRAVNNGFLGCRQVIGDNTNGKMSEYHACVGMAELDRWAHKQTRYEAMATTYRNAFRTVGLADRIHVGGEVSAVYALCHCPDAMSAETLRMALAYDGYETRFWYGAGLHAEQGFGPYTHDPMPNTDTLASQLVGLPAYLDLPDAEMEQIAATVARVI